MYQNRDARLPKDPLPKERFEKRNRRRTCPRIYHQKLTKADGSPGWQGTKQLPLSAEYTVWFCRAVFRVWQKQFAADQQIN